MKTIAVIGEGSSGLAAADLLRRRRVDLFEQDRRPGGDRTEGSTTVGCCADWSIVTRSIHRETIRAQRLWRDVRGGKRSHYCGAYGRHEFHEEGLYSARGVTRALGVEW